MTKSNNSPTNPTHGLWYYDWLVDQVKMWKVWSKVRSTWVRPSQVRSSQTQPGEIKWPVPVDEMQLVGHAGMLVPTGACAPSSRAETHFLHK